jgi:DNA ligase (NAD+)
LFEERFNGEPYTKEKAVEFINWAKEGWEKKKWFVFLVRNAKGEISDIGPKVAQEIVNFFNSQENLEMIERMQQAGLSLENPYSDGDLPLEGYGFVFTGSLENVSRNEAKELVQKKGAEVHSSVTNDTDYVVVGDNPGSKLNQAQQKGIKVLSEREFNQLLNEKS